jgi:hypothetical protein
MKKIIICFASEDKKYGNRFYRSQSILIESAKPHFDGFAAFNPQSLDKEFIDENKHILKAERGYGYWLWKPFIINKTLKHLNNGDLFFYVDSGNSIVGDINLLFDKAEKDINNLILFDNRDGAPEGTYWKNYQWTKYDSFKKMDCLEEKYIQGKQINGSYILGIKNNFTVNFFNEYFDYCKDEDILTDIPNKLGSNFDGFHDHRHDQSILSLLAIKHNITVLRDPSESGNSSIKPTDGYPQIFLHHRGFI